MPLYFAQYSTPDLKLDGIACEIDKFEVLAALGGLECKTSMHISQGYY